MPHLTIKQLQQQVQLRVTFNRSRGIKKFQSNSLIEYKAITLETVNQLLRTTNSS
jgi:hypothetical protein